jgi:hypothetical protein
MPITIDFTPNELSPDDITLIRESLGLTVAQTDDALAKLAKTAFMEYLKMFKEKGVPTRADEVQQERLFFLLKYYYENRLPSESEVSTIFQLSQSQSKTLLKNTKSRYRNKIGDFIKHTARNTLNTSAQNRDGNYEFICTSPSTIDDLNAIVTQKGPELRPIERIRGMASKFLCEADTYNLLQRELA